MRKEFLYVTSLVEGKELYLNTDRISSIESRDSSSSIIWMDNGKRMVVAGAANQILSRIEEMENETRRRNIYND